MRLIFASALLVLASAAFAFGAAIEVPLTVTERAGVARIGNHVNSGVPLPQGAVKDVAELGLFTADGEPVNAQITVRCRWLADKSLKFVTVHFPCDVAANGAAKFVLKTAPAKAAATVQTTVTDGAITVETGAIKFVVTKAGFNVLDQVWLDGEQVVAPGAASLKLRFTRGEFKVAGKLATVVSESEPAAAKAVARTLELEEAGPVRAVVKVTGVFEADGGKTLDFVARIYALASSPSVRVAFSVINRVGTKFASFVGIKELSLTVPLAEAGGDLKYTFAATKDPDISGTVAAGETVSLGQLASTEFTVNGKTYPGGREQKSRRLGWVDLTGSKVGLAAGIRYLWQLHPKGLEVTGDGAVKVLIVAPVEKLAGGGGVRSVPMFTGAARMHELIFAFHKAGEAGGARAMGGVDPLFAAADPKWYCQQTNAFGQIYDADLANFKPEYREKIKAFQATLEKSFASVLGYKDGKRQKGVEEYGFFNWGANAHHGSLIRPSGWIDSAWNGNYYDFPFAVMLNFVRTGNPECWDIAQIHAQHIADIDICHWHPTIRKLNGIEHVGYSIGHFRQFWRSEPFGVSGNADSTKNQSLYHVYYMTGDAWFRDVAMLISNYNAVHGGGSLRAVGNRMTGLYGSYELTHDPKHFERWKAFVYKAGIGRAKSRGLRGWDQDWMYGLAAEGLMTYYRTTGDLEAAKAVKTCADSLINTFWVESKGATKSSINGFTLNCFGYAYELTGDPEYLTKGLSQLVATAGRVAGRSKSFAQQFRLSPQFFKYLAADYQPPKPVLKADDRFEGPKPKPPKPAITSKISRNTGQFFVTKDARITCHPSEETLNSGGGTKLRVRNINSRSGELTILDFDTAALAAFLKANAGKSAVATLTLNVQRLQNGPIDLHVMPLTSATDWGEGVGVQKKPNKGECSYKWAATNAARWQTADGKDAEDLRAIHYHRTGRKLLAKENAKTARVKAGMKSVTIPLDGWILADLATREGNRGLLLFVAQDVDGPQCFLDFFSRETKRGAVLTVTVGQ